MSLQDRQCQAPLEGRGQTRVDDCWTTISAEYGQQWAPVGLLLEQLEGCSRA